MRPLIIGEVLFDCFKEQNVLGGAPFNVAWNLKGFGSEPMVLTAVGTDSLGKQVLENMLEWGMDLSGIRVLEEFSTGRVDVAVRDGQPTYTFVDNVAFDHLQPLNDPILANRFAILYHGSLALRAAESRKTVQHIRSSSTSMLFVDVNIRLPHFDRHRFEPYLQNVDHVKLNHEELAFLLGDDDTDFVAQPGMSWDERHQQALQLQSRFGAKNLWVTAGGEGMAWLGCSGQFLQVDAPKVEELVDTVGAGDAVSAVIIWGILKGLSPAELLPIAVGFAAKVCTLRGAITRQKEFYRLERRS